MNLKEPTISIQMVTYNRGEYIVEAMESVCNQSFSNWELLVIDDGSDDDTADIVRSFAEKDQRIIYIRHDVNHGIVSSRNEALQKSRGAYIAVLDSDDMWCDNKKLEKQLNVMKKENVVLVGGNVHVVNKDGRRIKDIVYSVDDHNIRKKILYRNQFAHSSVLYKKEVADSVGGYGSYLVGEDYDLFLRLGAKGKMCNIDDIVLSYRIHDSNISIKKRLDALATNYAIIKKYKDIYPYYMWAMLRRLLRLTIGRLLFH